MSQEIHLVHLYPVLMNIYGDTGNRLVLQRRMEWRGIKVRTTLVEVGDDIPKDADIILGGGAQDAVQSAVEADLQQKADILLKLAEDGVVMLMVCGMYQLFGRRFVTGEGREIKGIGILPLETHAGQTRFIGNTIYRTPWGEVAGYENHSGLTMLDDTAACLAQVVKGAGNNGQDGTEGCLQRSVFGTYSHGPILAKNPALADELIRRAIERKYGQAELQPLDDTLELRAAKAAMRRPR
ncbi:MAG TPA: glutamine amidotransferase [Candidatus Saccharimonadales bacterium]|nr:glutamine amidotransferase [Candidatus Saccharimonadales bacterium]